MVTWTVEGVAKLIPQFIMILGMPSILHVCDKSDSRSVKEYSLPSFFNFGIEFSFRYAHINIKLK